MGGKKRWRNKRKTIRWEREREKERKRKDYIYI